MIAGVEQEPDSGYVRLEQQIRWYDSKSGSAQWWYKRVKLCEFVASGLVPIAALTLTGLSTAIIGGLAVVLEGLQEALRHEKYSYIARSGSYLGMSDDDALKTLVERVESLVSTEHAKWITRQEFDPKKVKREQPQPEFTR